MGITEIQEHRKGKRLYGYFITQDNGVKVYVAVRKHSDIYRARDGSLSSALREGTAGWALDVETLMMARRRGCAYIVVFVRRRKDLWVCRMADFLNTAKSQLVDWSGRGGSSQRMLPLQYFAFREGVIRL